MAARLSRLIAVMVALAAAPPGGARAQSGNPVALGREVVTRAMIEEAGVLRLGEVVRLAPAWNAATVDDFTWRASPRGLGAAAEDGWTLLVDDRPVEIGALGLASLERLPIDLVSIDSIVFTSSPSLAAGAVAPAGMIHIHTSLPSEGVSVRARLGFGSETGDPGPFTFLPGGRLNRDRYGHESAGEVGLRSGAWSAAASYAASVHLPTDPLILQRMYASSTLMPRIERAAPAVRIGFDGGGSRHRLIAGTSRIDDWHRVEPAGIELPVRSDLVHASAAGTFAESGFDLGYRVGYDRSRVASYREATAPPIDFEWQAFHGTLEASPRGGAHRLGLRFAHRSASSDSREALGRHAEFGVFGEVTVRSSRAVRHHLAATLSGRGHGIEGGAILTNDAAIGGGLLLFRLTASRTRSVPPAGLLDLAALGEPWLATAGITAQLPPSDRMLRMAGAELGWSGRRESRTSFTVSAYLRAFDGSLTLRRDLRWDPVYRAWRGPVLVHAAAGRTAGGRLGVRHRASRTLDLSADVDISRAYGDASFRRNKAAFPTLRAVGAAVWRPVAGFGLRTDLELESERRWPDYEDAEAAPGKARSIQPAAAVVSLSGWKTFLDGRLRGQFAARNLTSRRIILHPEGRASTLSFLFLLGADF